MQPDADDTAKSILVLNLAQRPTAPDALLRNFETETHFRTYEQERDPSFSANCNVLIALLHAPDPSRNVQAINKSARFLCDQYLSYKSDIRDKWVSYGQESSQRSLLKLSQNISPYYPFMLISQAFTRLRSMWNDGDLDGLSDELAMDLLPHVLESLMLHTLETQNTDGTWGISHSYEETAYAVLALANGFSSVSLKSRHSDIAVSITKAREVLLCENQQEPTRLWVEKVTYSSEILTESYVLAALNSIESSLARFQSQKVEIPTLNGTNGHSHHLEPQSAQLSGTNGLSKANGKSIAVKCPNYRSAKDNASHAASSFTSSLVSPWSSSEEAILLLPYTYLEKVPGKDIRSVFLTAINAWLLVPEFQLEIIARIVKMLHTASLLVDDIEDSSTLRRGVPVAHAIYGIPSTFNAGNYVYFLALRELSKLKYSEAAIEIFSEELINLHRGQGLDLYWRDTLTCPSEEEYLGMVSNKTGGLFRLAARLLQTQSPFYDAESKSCSRDCTPLVSLLGLVFQICDDYLNLQSNSYMTKKGMCEDISEGKFSFPIIHSIQTAKSDPTQQSDRQLMNILKLKTQDEELKAYAISLMKTTGSFEYTKEYVRELGSHAAKTIEGFEESGWGKNDTLKNLLEKITTA